MKAVMSVSKQEAWRTTDHRGTTVAYRVGRIWEDGTFESGFLMLRCWFEDGQKRQERWFSWETEK